MSATSRRRRGARRSWCRRISPIQTVADLKGKNVALNKGSNVHYLLVKALEAAGIGYADIKTVVPAAGRRARRLREGRRRRLGHLGSVPGRCRGCDRRPRAHRRHGMVENHQFYLAARTFAERESGGGRGAS